MEYVPSPVVIAYHFGGKDSLYLAVQQAWLRQSLKARLFLSELLP